MRLKLTVGPEGEIAVPPHEANSLGLSGGGPLEFLSARGVCALLVPARPDAPKAFFAGTLSALTVAEVVQFVFSSLKTGVLLLDFGGDAAKDPRSLRRRSLYFRDGQIVFATSSDPGDRLGPVLIEQKLITQSQLDHASSLVTSARPLGHALVDEGILTPAQLYLGISAQVREIFLSSFVETEGTFAFLEGPTDEFSQVKLADRTRDLLLLGLKRLEQAETRRDVREEPSSPKSETGFALDPVEPASAAQPTGPFETYRRLLKHVRKAMAPHLPDAVERINGWFERQPDRKKPLFIGISMADDGSVDTTKVLENVMAMGVYQGAAARARALEALEELLSFALFEAKNRMPRPEAEQLLRVVGRMQGKS